MDCGVFMRLAILFVVCMTSIGGWAESATFQTKGRDVVNNNACSFTDTSSGITVKISATESDVLSSESGSIKIAKGKAATLTISSTNDITITNVSITNSNSSGTFSYGENSASISSNGTAELNGLNIAVTSSTITDFTITNTGTGALKICPVVVTYTTSGGETTTKTFDDVTVEKQMMTVVGTLDLSQLVSAKENGTAVSGASISYKITSGGDYVSLSGNILTGKAAGSAVVTATISADGYTSKSVTINVTVTAAAAANEDMTATAKSGITLTTGGTRTIAASDFTVTGPTDFNITLTSSSNTSAATVSGTTITGVAEGTSTISYTLTASGYNDYSGTFDITVAASLPVPEITVDDPVVLEQGQELKLNGVMVNGKMISDYTITWNVGDNTNKFVVDGSTIKAASSKVNCTITATVNATDEYAASESKSINVYILSSDGQQSMLYLNYDHTTPIEGSTEEGAKRFTEVTATNYPDEGISKEDYIITYTIKAGQTFMPKYVAMYDRYDGTNYVLIDNPNIVYKKTTDKKTCTDLSTTDYVKVNEDGSITGVSEGEIILVGWIPKVQAVYRKSEPGDYDNKSMIRIRVSGNIPTPTITPGTSIVEEESLEVTIGMSGTDTENAVIYYTTDGTEPSATNGTEIDNNGKVNITFSNSGDKTTVKAIVIVNGTAESAVTEATYTYIKKAETTEETDKTAVIIDTDAQGYDAGDRIVRDDIVMTFGGVYTNTKDNAWDRITGDKTGALLGSASSIAAYSVTNENDAVIETADVATTAYADSTGKADNTAMANEYKHYKQNETVGTYDRIKNLPAYGNYFKFEPNKNGTLKLYVEQQGSINVKKNAAGVDENQLSVIRLRPLYFVDELGISQEADAATTTSRINSNWKNIDTDEFADPTDDSKPMFTAKQMNDIHDFYMSYLKDVYQTKNASATNVGRDNILSICDNETENPIFILHSKGDKVTMNNSKVTVSDETKAWLASMQEIFDRETSADDATVQTAVKDNTGYFLMTEGYIQYEFKVNAGKTYFLFGDRTKIGLSGFEFTPSSTTETTDITLAASPSSDNANSTVIEDAAGKTVNATINRSFTKDYWYSLVLPFSVSTTQPQSVLSETTNTAKGRESDLPNESGMRDVNILYFAGIDGTTLNLRHYFHHFIPAGTPVFIRAEKTVSSVTFTNVYVEKTSVEPVEIGQYKLNGSYDAYDAPVHSYILLNGGNAANINADSGKFFQNETGNVYSLDAMSAAIEGETAEKAISINGMDEDGGTSGIVETVASGKANGAICGNGAIYNLNGQVVGHGLELYTLPKGIYITNGKKHIVR